MRAAFFALSRHVSGRNSTNVVELSRNIPPALRGEARAEARIKRKKEH
jgi:hypothetical protein